MTPHRTPGVRALLVGAAVVATAVLTACGPGDPGPGATPSTTTGPSVTSAPTDVRGRLVAALEPTSPAGARLVQKPDTKLVPVETAWLSGWQIIDVTSMTPPKPQRFYAALADDGRVEVLTGRPDLFSKLVVDAGVDVDSATVATAVGAVFLDATRDFKAYAYRIDSVEDIDWLPKPGAGEQAVRDELRKTYAGQVKPAQAAESGDGWQVSIWMVQGRDLVRHSLGVASGTAVTDQVETLEKDIPVPYSA